MAIESNTLSTRMQLRFIDGVDENGNDVVKSKSYSNVKNTATDEDIYDVANAMAALQTKTVEGVRKVVEVMIVEV